MTPIIEVESLGKRYRIGKRVPYRTLRESLVSAASAPFRLVRGGMRYRGSETNDGKPQVWALRDVSFEIMPGEVLGVIGRNGAGKSTLLKILSRITEPTEGRARLRGRVGSLLEVGTGFHPELTGLENIHLSGAILGMRRAEIQRKLDEIITFAEVETFIDTPVKHYSSGMYTRLAFAVAAHMETEILLVDEVLAVGDVAFQKKCLGKMGDVAKEGRTVLFVSHNTASIEALCDSCVLLNNGRLQIKGPSREVLQKYMSEELRAVKGFCELTSHPGRDRSSVRCMNLVTLSTPTGRSIGVLRMGSALSISVEFSCGERSIHPILGVVVKTLQGAPVFGVNNLFIKSSHLDAPIASGSITCSFDSLPLLPGTYLVDLWLTNGREKVDVVYGAVSFEVVPADVFESGQLPPPGTGPIFWPAKFSITGERSSSLRKNAAKDDFAEE